MSGRYEHSYARLTSIEYYPTWDKVILGDPSATAFVVEGTLTELRDFAQRLLDTLPDSKEN